MPTILLLQDLLTVTASVATAMNQPQSEYLDLTNCQDIWIYTYLGSVAAASGGNLVIQTAPVAEDGAFAANVLATYVSGTASVGWQTPVGAHMGATPALARYLRWATTIGTGGYTWTFRIYVAANPVGLR